MDTNDDSDLTDIESGGDDDKTYTLPKSAPKKPIYTIKNTLKVPRASTYSAQALYGVHWPLYSPYMR